MGRELVALRLANVADDWPIPDADPVTEVMPTTDDRLPPDDGQPVNTAEEWLIRVTRGSFQLRALQQSSDSGTPARSRE